MGHTRFSITQSSCAEKLTSHTPSSHTQKIRRVLGLFLPIKHWSRRKEITQPWHKPGAKVKVKHRRSVKSGTTDTKQQRGKKQAQNSSADFYPAALSPLTSRSVVANPQYVCLRGLWITPESSRSLATAAPDSSLCSVGVCQPALKVLTKLLCDNLSDRKVQ